MSQTFTPISSIGKFQFIERLCRRARYQNASSCLGIGDDAALIDPQAKVALSTELFIEGIHFDLAYCPLKYIGYKTVVAGISDIYAMGAEPMQILLSVAVSNRFSTEVIEGIYEGVHESCQYYGVDLVGGDLTSSRSGMTLSITAVGQLFADTAYTRKGAQAGDVLCVSGALGEAYLGLVLLEREKQVQAETKFCSPEFDGQKHILQRYLRPDIPTDLFRVFEENEVIPHAMTDVTDGLASDVVQLCSASQCGCLLVEDQLPISESARQFAYSLSFDPTTAILYGGDDFEFLFALSASDYEKVKHSAFVCAIGITTETPKSYILRTKGGVDHDFTAPGFTPQLPHKQS